ncbi:hypothetical protein B0H15DRAFT_953272 [Mycena belliarum]|uniref:Uncharacterized protein n=1 Tax=Mycena belliarum TaxID=1033014 RepID=A0AAD6TXI8_9AGAR|nr:hypothetical protein B0H15DRAFT_953272 [Mycena belliae]
MVNDTGKPARKATKTAAARAAAALAAAESKEEEDTDGKKPRRPRGRPKKVVAEGNPPRKKKGQQDGSDSDEPEGDSKDEEGAGVDIDWNNDIALTWTLINAIEEDADTRRCLFPPPGSSKRNSGLPKKHYHKILAVKCFAKHSDYAEAYAKPLKPKMGNYWTDKIKNRIKVLVDKARAHMVTMGRTGAGVESQEDVVPGTELATKWDEIVEDLPWFWSIRSLIAERPNLRPVGIGNNASDVDTSLLFPEHDAVDRPRASSFDSDFPEHLADAPRESSELGANDPDRDRDTGDDDEDSDSDDSASVKPAKRKAATPEPTSGRPTKRTKPRPAVSTPAPAKSKSTAKPATTKDKFSAVVIAEEETQQQRLGLKKHRNSARKDIELAKIKALAVVQVEKTKIRGQESLAKIELALMCLRRG